MNIPIPNRVQTTLTGHNGPVHAVAFSANTGQYVLTGCSDRAIRLFNPRKATIENPSLGLVQSYEAHGYEVLDLSVTNDNARFASVGGDKQVFLWDVATARTLRRWAGHFARVNCVNIGGADEQGSVVVSGSFDSTVRIWDAKSQSTKPIQTLDQARDSVSDLHVLGWEIVTGSVDGRLRTYDLRMGVVRTDVLGSSITSVHQTKDGQAILASSLDSTIRLIDKTNGRLLQSFKGHANDKYRVRACFGHLESTVLSGSEDGTIFAWDLVKGTIVSKIQAHQGKIASAVAWNNRQQQWASAGTDGTVNVYGPVT